MSLAAQSVLVKLAADHMPVVLYTQDNMDANKPFPVANIPPVRFIVGPTSQGIIGIIQGACYSEI